MKGRIVNLMKRVIGCSAVLALLAVSWVSPALAADSGATPAPAPQQAEGGAAPVGGEPNSVAIDVVTRNLVSAQGASVTISTSITDSSAVKTDRTDPQPTVVVPGGVLDRTQSYAGVLAKGRYLVRQRILAISGTSESRVEQDVTLLFGDDGVPRAEIASKTAIPELGNRVLDLKDPLLSPLLISVKIGRVKLEVVLTAKAPDATLGDVVAEFYANPSSDGSFTVKHSVPATIEGTRISATSPMLVSPLESLPFRVRLLGPQGVTLSDIPARYNFATGGVLVDTRNAAPFERERFASVSLYGRDSAQSYDIKLPPLRQVGETEESKNKEGRPIRVTIDYLDPTPAPVQPAAVGAGVQPAPAPAAPGSLTVQVLRVDTSEVLPQARVLALQGNSRYLARTNAEGVASFKDMPPGQFTLRVENQGFEPVSLVVQIDSGRLTHHAMALSVKPTKAELALPLARWGLVALVGTAIILLIGFVLYRRRARQS